MNKELQLAKALGAASVAVGLAQLFAGRRIRDSLGLPIPAALVNAAGSNRVASGFVVLAHPDEAGPIGVRLAGDALDLAVLGSALLTGNRRTRPAAMLATAAAVGLAVLDVTAALALRKRQSRILETARRTRVASTAMPQLGSKRQATPDAAFS